MPTPTTPGTPASSSSSASAAPSGEPPLPADDPTLFDLDLRGRGLAERGADFHRGRAAGFKVGLEPGQGQAGVNDVLDDQDILAHEVRVQVLEDADNPRGLGAGAVGGNSHPVHGDVAVECPGEVCHDHHRPLEHTNNEDFTAFVVLVDLRSEFGDPVLDLFLGVENVLEVCLDVV